MENKQSLFTELKQTQQLSVNLLQSLKLLNMPMQELQVALNNELEVNPTLEVELPSDAIEQMKDNSIDTESEYSGDDDAWQEELYRQADQWQENLDFYSSENYSRGGQDDYNFCMNSIAELSPSLHEQLYEELYSELNVTPNLKEATQTIIDAIDEKGYLSSSIEELSMNTNLSIEILNKALKIVQKLDPAGIGARNIGECIKLQLDRDGKLDDLYINILDNYLEEIALNHLPAIAKKLQISIAELNLRLDALKIYNPYPGRAISNESVQYISPEVAIIQNDDGEFEAKLLYDKMPRPYLSKQYIDMLSQKNLTSEERNYLKSKIQSSKDLIGALELRKSTILRIAETLIKKQRNFLESGKEFLAPLTMNNVAEELNLHETTISRAVANKYIETPQGTFPLKYFFSSGVSCNDGEELSNKTIKDKIKEFIKNENPNKPLSDEVISKKLKDDGINIARRTVAKYRESMNIPPTNIRKKHT